MTAPTVSVIIPTYNWSSVLRYAIQSVRWQSFQDFELLVVGDGCTDDSAEVVASFGDARIRWYNLPRNSGNQSAPNNFGIEQARGRYIAYLGHDDLWYPNHLELLVQASEAKHADFACSVVVMIGPPPSGIRIVKGAVGPLGPGTLAPPSGTMHRRAVVAEIGGWKDYREIDLPPDSEFVQRAWNLGKRFAAVPALTVFKFNSAWRPGSYMQKSCAEQAEYARRIVSEPDFLEREQQAIDLAYATGKTFCPTDSMMPPCPKNAPRGWRVEQFRRIRGLPPGTS